MVAQGTSGDPEGSLSVLSVRAPVGICEIILISLLSKGGDLDSKILPTLQKFEFEKLQSRVSPIPGG